MMAFQYSGQSTFRALGRAKYAVFFFAFAQGVHCCTPDFAAAVLLESRCEWRICGRAGVQLHRRSGVLLTMRHVVMPELKMEN